MQKVLKNIGEVFQIIVKMKFCKHTYRKLSTVSGTHSETGKEVIFCVIYQCTKCGKQLIVNYDKDYQIDN